MYTKVAGSWRETNTNKVKVAGAWRDADVHTKVAGSWRVAFVNIKIQTPTITNTTTTGVGFTPSFYTSDFSLIHGEDTHYSSDWVVKKSNGTIVLQYTNDTNKKTSMTVPSGSSLLADTSYIVEVRHRGASLKYSGWASFSFNTRSPYIDAPTITEPTDSVISSGTTARIADEIVVLGGGTDTRDMVEWQLTEGYSDVKYSGSGTSTYWNVSSSQIDSLTKGSTLHYFKARVRGATYGWSSWRAHSFRTELGPAFVKKPTIYPPFTGTDVNYMTSHYNSEFQVSSIEHGGDTTGVNTYLDASVWELYKYENSQSTLMLTVELENSYKYKIGDVASWGYGDTQECVYFVNVYLRNKDGMVSPPVMSGLYLYQP